MMPHVPPASLWPGGDHSWPEGARRQCAAADGPDQDAAHRLAKARSMGRAGRLLSAAVLAAAVAAASPRPDVRGQGGAPPAFPDGLAVGDATHEAAVLWTRAPSGGPVLAEVAEDPSFVGARLTGPVTPGAQTAHAIRLELRNLAPGRRYHVRVRAGTVRSPTATFVTPPAPDQDAPLALVWGADTYAAYQPFLIFEAMRRRQPDLFLYLGDTIYADLGPVRATTLEQYREKYRANRADAALRAFLASTSSWVIWDDHEVENNFASDHPRLRTGLQAFLEAWPVRTPSDEPGRSYRSLRWGHTAEIFLLDTRQYRSPERTPDGPAKTMLGAAQKQWLLDGLRRSTAAVKIIASTVALRYHGSDSWEGYRTERDEILRAIAEARLGTVVVLAADVHYAALIQHPEGVTEAIAGPLAAFPARRASAAGAPGVRWTSVGASNYGWLRVEGDRLTFAWYDAADQQMHEARLPVVRR